MWVFLTLARWITIDESLGRSFVLSARSARTSRRNGGFKNGRAACKCQACWFLVKHKNWGIIPTALTRIHSPIGRKTARKVYVIS